MDEAILKELCDIKKILALMVGAARALGSQPNSLRNSFEGQRTRASNFTPPAATTVYAREDPQRIAIGFSLSVPVAGDALWLTPYPYRSPLGVWRLDPTIHNVFFNRTDHGKLVQTEWSGFPIPFGQILNVFEVFEGPIMSAPPPHIT